MTTTSPITPSPAPEPGAAAHRPTLVTRTVPGARGLAVRNIRNIRRLPSAFLPALLMPIVQAVAFSGTFFAITQVPGFPTDRSINWYMPLAVLMGSSFAGVGIGFTTVRDLESGFYDRLRMAPVPRRALLLGPLMSAWARATLVMVIVSIVGIAMGARLTDGPLGLLSLYVAAIGMATIGAGWGLGLAYLFRDMRAAAIMQLTLFLALFLTTAQAPLEIMEGWLYEVASRNPFTEVLRLARMGFLGDIAWADTWPGLVALAAIGALAVLFARTGLARLDR
ncbi:MAG: ABC transporter permease [Ilumatobacteraceae bacterium]